ncbi:Egg cell-secreted protein 1.1 [Euphorbia peplus]|nr:Egg cell-secreted protein 1.1 [Euphorbia peplus]
MGSYILKLLLVIALLAGSWEFQAKARPVAQTSISDLRARLKLNQGSSNCWDSMIHLQACTTEILLFFLNGETRLGHSCCEAIHTISGNCWPNLMDTLGFTAEEGDILEGYCLKDAHDHSRHPAPPSPKQNNKFVRGQFSAP